MVCWIKFGYNLDAKQRVIERTAMFKEELLTIVLKSSCDICSRDFQTTL